MAGHLLDREAVRAANMAFYQAFEENDLDSMNSMWEHTERATCVHPGWPMLRGWQQVAAAWFTLLTNGAHNQFIITNEVVEVEGDVAWVTCDENVLNEASGATVAAMNMFVLSDGRWRLVSHVGGQVSH
jgi:ketosteroid isomerase-like protein